MSINHDIWLLLLDYFFRAPYCSYNTLQSGQGTSRLSRYISSHQLHPTVYPPARRKLAEHGISCEGKTARQMTRSDYDRFDLLVGMDEWNIRNMKRIAGGDPDRKIFKMLDFTSRHGDVADPWYTGNFDATWRDCLEGCEMIFQQYK